MDGRLPFGDDFAYGAFAMEDQRNQTVDVRPGALRDSLGTQPAIYARYLILANGIGLVTCLGVMSQLGGYAPARDILMTSAMALGLGAAAGTLAYSVFPIARRYEAAAEALERQAGDNAREKRRAEKKMKRALRFSKGGGQLLLVSGVCLLTSILVGIKDLLSL